jgi:hypothetical protein
MPTITTKDGTQIFYHGRYQSGTNGHARAGHGQSRDSRG